MPDMPTLTRFPFCSATPFIGKYASPEFLDVFGSLRGANVPAQVCGRVHYFEATPVDHSEELRTSTLYVYVP